MNRVERRKAAKAGIVIPAEPAVMMKQSDVNRIRKNAVDDSFILMLAIPTLVIRDKFGDLMRKDGREERFVNHCLEVYEAYDQGYFTFEELKQCLYDETGITFEKKV